MTKGVGSKFRPKNWIGSTRIRVKVNQAGSFVWNYSMSFIDGCESMLASSIGRVGSEQGQASKWIWPERNQAKIQE